MKLFRSLGSLKLLRSGALLLIPSLTAAAGAAAVQPPPAPAALPEAPARAVSPEDAVVLIRTSNSLRSTRGSGFLIGDGSWVVTASHVVSVDLGKGRRVSDQTALVYVPWTGRPYEARVMALDGPADIALLKLPQSGFPALPLEGLEVTDANAALAALKDRPLRLFGFPLTYGEATVASLARPEQNDSKIREIAKRGDTSLSVLQSCPDAQPGWSGGPIVSLDRNSVVAVFHSRYYPKANAEESYPAGSVTGHLAQVLRSAGITDFAPFVRPPASTLPRPKAAGELMAQEMRSLSWSAAGMWEKAEEEQRSIVAREPSDALARCELGRLLLVQKKYPEGLKELQEAARLAPQSVTVNLYLGKAYHLNFKPKEAAAALQAALRSSPDEVEPQLALADLHEANQQPAEAEAVLRAAREKAPLHPGLVFRLGQLVTAQGKKQEGLKLMEEAAELARADPAIVTIPLHYGRALEDNKKYREAESLYRVLLKNDPGNPSIHFALTVLYYRTGRFEDAQIQLNQGIRLPGLSEPMLQSFRQLQELINNRGGVGPPK
ncbi:MAG: tetratricopeptide repeat protein [Armatimonadota bacterium]